MTFDLENARAADEVLPYPLDAKEIWVSGKGQMHINPPNAPSIFFTLSDLCEFRNIFHGQAAEIERLRAEISEQKGMIWKTQQVKKEQYAQIKELKADLEQSERVIEAQLDVIDQQAAKIRELEDVHKRSGVKYAKIINELRSSVYANIPGLDVGKIGPDAKPRSWQITEERKAALAAMSNLSETISCPDCGVWIGFADIGPHMAVLRAMLTEAGL